MMIFSKARTAIAACIAGAFVVMASANAATVSFTDWSSTNNPLLVLPVFTVTETAGGFDVSVDIDASSPETGKLSGIFFDLSDSITQGDIGGFPVTINDFDNNTNNLGGGVNVTPFPAFDVGIGFAQTTLNSAFTFFVSDLGGTLELADWTRVALRFQSVGNNGDDSDKLLSSTTVGEVPLPGAIWLMGAGLAGLGLARRKKAVA